MDLHSSQRALKTSSTSAEVPVHFRIASKDQQEIHSLSFYEPPAVRLQIPLGAEKITDEALHDLQVSQVSEDEISRSPHKKVLSKCALRAGEQAEIVERMRRYSATPQSKEYQRAACELIAEMDGLIKWWIGHFKQRDRYDDLYQAGCEGVFICLKTFDASEGGNFASMASNHIRNTMISVLKEALPMIVKETPLSKEVRRQMKRLKKANRACTPEIIAGYLGRSVEKIREVMERLYPKSLSLEKPLSPDNKSALKDLIHNETSPSPSEAVWSHEIHSFSREGWYERFTESLNATERLVLFCRHPFEDEYVPLSKEIADRIDVSRVRIGQIESKVLEKLASFAKLSKADHCPTHTSTLLQRLLPTPGAVRLFAKNHGLDHQKLQACWKGTSLPEFALKFIH